LANWMTQGDPGFDIWGMDVSRFGDFSTSTYTREKVAENYGRRFRITYPNEFLPAARPLQTTPIHNELNEFNAVWGDSYGLEVPQWFQKPGQEPIEELTWHRSNSWDSVAEESAAVRNGVGLIDTTGFSKFEFSGSGSRGFLSHILAGRIPQPGRLALSPMLNSGGKIIGDLTLGCLAAAVGEAEGPFNTIVGGATGNTDESERFYLFGSGVAERYYERYFDQQLQSWTGDPCRYRTLGYELTGLSIAGPDSRQLLERCVDDDVSNAAFSFMQFRQMEVGLAPALVGRLTYTGDLGYEFWIPASYQRYLFQLLLEHGRDLGIRLFGTAALNSLRLEKSFGSWGREFRPIYDPYEAGLGGFLTKDRDFVGADALAALLERSERRSLRTWVIDGPDGLQAADVLGDEPIWFNDEVVGWVTSGGYAHNSGKSVAMGYIPAALENSDQRWQVEILGVMRDATLLNEPIFDPAGKRMRG
ncbi:MAG: glycine cleavage T C-terminal barrel domain-containing protein, partial [Actinomycetota bacterium]|nr:glycine cleavage T C-terminal barrel domain-containing protein [Actinomycetota bacterium]